MSAPRKRKLPAGGQDKLSFPSHGEARQEESIPGFAAGKRNRGALSKFPPKIEQSHDQPAKVEVEAHDRETIPDNGRLYFAAIDAITPLLKRAADGDAQAAAFLLDCLNRNIQRFQKLCEDNPRLAAAIVRPGEPWPLLHTDLKMRKGYLTIPEGHQLRTLKVVKTHRSIGGDNLAHATCIALKLYGRMDYYRKLTVLPEDYGETILAFRKLPPLTPATVADWWRAANPFFVEHWGKEFQDGKDFKGWNSEAYPKEAHLARSHKRADIKRRIKQGFESIAKDCPYSELAGLYNP